MRNMSFAFTVPQMRCRTKTVTRRLGWWDLKVGDVVCAVEKGRGLKKGEKVQRLGPIRIVSVRREKLDAITCEECALEGFPDYAPPAFIAMFCRANKCWADGLFVNRIEFRFL